MSANIEIVNTALSHLAKPPITSLEDDSNTAQIMKTNYYICRNKMFEDHEWTFALKEFIPAQNADAPDFGASHSFAIPSDIVRVVSVDYNPRKWGDRAGSFNEPQKQAEWQIVGQNIYTDRDKIYCYGIRKMEDEGYYSPGFVMAFSYRLAMMCCYAITKSNTRYKDLAQMFKYEFDAAVALDSVQGSNRRIRRGNLQRARRSYGSLR